MVVYDSVINYAAPAYGTIFAGHFHESDRYSSSRPTGMKDWLITYTLEGGGYFRVGDDERTCSAGDVAILRNDVPHEYGTVPGGRWNFIWAHFPGLPETKYLPDEDLHIQHLGNADLQNRVYRALRNVLQDSRERRALWRQTCENELRGILLLMAERSARRWDRRIEETLHYISRHMKEISKVDDIARAIGLSSSRLSHLFKQETGSTLVEKLNGMRIEQAAMLMKHAGRTATEAAYDVGYRNYNHFAALFRERIGVSPREYLRRSDDRATLANEDRK